MICFTVKYVVVYPQKVLGGLSPMGGVANVCRPTSWAGPRPSRKSLNCASEESLTPGKMRLKQRDTKACVYISSRFQKVGGKWIPWSVSLLSLWAVAVHAAVRGLPARLAGHPASHLHRQARLRAPLDRATQFLASCFWSHVQNRKIGKERETHTRWRTVGRMHRIGESDYRRTLWLDGPTPEGWRKQLQSL